MKKPWLAALLNIIPGVGYLYLDTRKIFAGLLIACWAVSFLSGFFDPAIAAQSEQYLFSPWVLLPAALSGVAFIIDGYLEAKRINQGSKTAKPSKK